MFRGNVFCSLDQTDSTAFLSTLHVQPLGPCQATEPLCVKYVHGSNICADYKKEEAKVIVKIMAQVGLVSYLVADTQHGVSCKFFLILEMMNGDKKCLNTFFVEYGEIGKRGRL